MGTIQSWELGGKPLREGVLTFLAVVAGHKWEKSDVLWQQEVLELAFVGERFQRLGILASTRANLRTLLERGALVVAFPEGNAATAKTYDRRYRLARFEDSFVFDEARSAGARIVPGAVIGNEESFPVLGHVGAVPITPSRSAMERIISSVNWRWPGVRARQL